MSETWTNHAETQEVSEVSKKLPFEQLSPEKQEKLKKLVISKEIKKLGISEQIARLQAEVGGVLSEESAKELLKKDNPVSNAIEEAKEVWGKIADKAKELWQAGKEFFGIDKAEKTVNFFDVMKEKWDSLSSLWEKGDIFAIFKVIFTADFWDFRSFEEKMESGIKKLAAILDLDTTTIREWKNFLVNDDDFTKWFGNVSIKKLRELATKDNVNPISELGLSGGNVQDTKNFLGKFFASENFSKIVNQIDMKADSVDDLTFTGLMSKIGK